MSLLISLLSFVKHRSSWNRSPSFRVLVASGQERILRRSVHPHVHTRRLASLSLRHPESRVLERPPSQTGTSRLSIVSGAIPAHRRYIPLEDLNLTRWLDICLRRTNLIGSPDVLQAAGADTRYAPKDTMVSGPAVPSFEDSACSIHGADRLALSRNGSSWTRATMRGDCCEPERANGSRAGLP